jgi:type IV pilus assembly protein PilB
LRKDGILHTHSQLDLIQASRLCTRLKILAQLDIAERRLPQDGHFQTHAGLDIRISTCPTLHGEKLVLRLLKAADEVPALDELGMTAEQVALVQKKIQQPQGLILMTGPTGSGKTLTLYSILKYLNRGDKNISTAEDPIEIQLPGINQVPLNPKAGLSFATALRAFLRQDPDVIMLGEIRDAETANMAVQAALTGHLVLSSLHTNSAYEAIARLKALGIKVNHLAQALSLIVSQRLVRLSCPACGLGCEHCDAGFSGRSGIFECLAVNEPLREALHQGIKPQVFLKLAERFGYSSLAKAGHDRVQRQQTTLAELQRVL